MANESEYVIVGKIGATFGIKGWLKIISYTQKQNDILEYHPWYLENGKNWEPLQIIEGQQHGKGVIVHIKGYDQPETARVLTGKNIAVERSQLPKLKEGEYYWKDLEGLT